jgi:hypothetical protein
MGRLRKVMSDDSDAASGQIQPPLAFAPQVYLLAINVGPGFE